MPRSKPRVLAELLEHVVEERDAGRDRRRAPRRRRRASSSIVVSFVSRCSSAVRPSLTPTTSGRTASSAARNASFSSGVPTVMRRQPSTRGHDEKSRTSTPRSSRRSHSSCASPSTRTSRKFAPDGHTVEAGACRRAPRTAGRAPRRATRPAAPSRARKSSATVPASCVGTDRCTAATPSRARRSPTPAPTAKPSRTAASDHTFEYVRTTTSGRSSSTSSSALHGANSP